MRFSYLVSALILLTGCAQTSEYRLSQASEKIFNLQILDSEAPVNNDGITRELQGDYAKRAAENYRNSIYSGKEGRNVEAKDNQ
ncbi:hypothetical protein OPS25_12690 [Alteromonas ponticola]|uniref:Lipoprotein n=1 Tax=Alteromonas aquimaris TaxID=2998417 RepID=A0ABT3P9B2_9ALTE|nr:hypothetical protein [Alteromonas aquimaris]MCW8109359.1 hypothetical protein [Alteromonas aquimaris]